MDESRGYITRRKSGASVPADEPPLTFRAFSDQPAAGQPCDEVLPIAALPTRQVQIFGTRKSAETRKALRFFAERRVAAHFVDFQERGPAPGELRRFTERFGVSSLVDRESRRFLDLGLQRSLHSDDWWLKRLTEEPSMLRQPLVRFGHKVTVGLDESTWREWLE